MNTKSLVLLFSCLCLPIILVLKPRVPPTPTIIISSTIEKSKEYPNPMIVWEFYPWPKHAEHAWVTESLPVKGSRSYPNVIRIENSLDVRLGHKVHIMQIIDVFKRPDGSMYTAVRETFGRKINP